jgi:rSAM/selenodomain-associated transferase 1
MTKSACRILYFCRAPVLGQVKSRLARQIGEHKALRVYQQLLEYNLQVGASIDFAEVEIVTTDTEHTYFDQWKQQGMRVSAQVGMSLGERMINAFRAALHESESVILLGTDSVDMNLDRLKTACQTLGNHQAVIQPVADGGYILIGLRSLNHEIFRGIDWGTERVFDQTLLAMQQDEMDSAVLGVVKDIDVFEDLITSGRFANVLADLE